MQSHAHEENNLNYLHTAMGSKLAITAEGRALGVNVGSSLEMSAQCSAAVKEANRMLAMIKRGMGEKSEHVIIVLCQSIERPFNLPKHFCLEMRHKGWDGHIPTCGDVKGHRGSPKDHEQPGDEEKLWFSHFPNRRTRQSPKPLTSSLRANRCFVV